METLVSVGSPHDVTEPLRPGRNFSFQLTFTNPLYEPVEVTAEILEPLDVEEQEDDENAYVIDNQAISGSDKGVSSSKSGDTTFDQWHASMPASTFGINAFAEAWEYEAEDDEDSDIGFDSNSTSASRKYGPGVLAKKANKTVVQLDLAVGREASGHVRIPLYITYTYTAEDPLLLTKQKANKQQETTSSTTQVSASTANPGDVSVNNYDEGVNPNLKTFSFWTSVPLGCVVPRVGLPGGSTLNVTEAQARRAASTSSLR